MVSSTLFGTAVLASTGVLTGVGAGAGRGVCTRCGAAFGKALGRAFGAAFGRSTLTGSRLTVDCPNASDAANAVNPTTDELANRNRTRPRARDMTAPKRLLVMWLAGDRGSGELAGFAAYPYTATSVAFVIRLFY
jgi:hypothetical protein